MEGYVVRFIRMDDKPCEEYYYKRQKDAQYHFDLFRSDDSQLYKKIVLAALNPETEIEPIDYHFS